MLAMFASGVVVAVTSALVFMYNGGISGPQSLPNFEFGTADVTLVLPPPG
jgi:hypothetical protein